LVQDCALQRQYARVLRQLMWSYFEMNILPRKAELTAGVAASVEAGERPFIDVEQSLGAVLLELAERTACTLCGPLAADHTAILAAEMERLVAGLEDTKKPKSDKC